MLPEINVISQTRDVVEAFAGYNHTDNTKDNQFYNMTNLTSDNYPVLSARKKRELIKEITKPNALVYTDTLAYVDGTELYYGQNKICELADSEKTLVTMGAYLVVFPDKIAVNTSTGDFFELEAHYGSVGTVKIEPCTYEGATLSYSTSEPEHVNGAYWLDNGVLKMWSETYSAWTSVATSYVRISEYIDGQINEHFTDGFEEGDTVTISGFDNDEYNGDFLLYKSDIYMVIAAETIMLEDDSISIDRTVPDMDYIIELNNRLWGCKDHEIYASKLGDPTNWKSYANQVSDSYAVTVGSYGEFTGAIKYNGSAMFFKEGTIIQIYGTQPSNFTLIENCFSGVEKGSSKSLAVLNGILYYKSKEGIMAYSGGKPSLISNALGQVFVNAVGGVTNSKYYVSMQDEAGNYHLFNYDTEKGIWIREDSTHVTYFANNAGNLYMVTGSELYVLRNKSGKMACPSVYVIINGESVGLCPGMFCPGQIFGDDYEETIEWSAETGDITCGYPDTKYVSKITLRLLVEDTFEMEIMYDGDDVWERILAIGKTKKKSVTIPVMIRRCDYFRLRMSGKGNFKLYSITKSVERGSEP